MSAQVEESVAAADQLILPPTTEPFVVIKQLVELDVDFGSRGWSGVSTLWLYVPDKDTEEISLDARNCEIDLENITLDGRKTTASHDDPYDLLKTPKQWQIGALQHHVMRKRMHPLTPQPHERPDLPVTSRESAMACVPVDRSLRISLRPEGKGEYKTLLKIKTSRVDGAVAMDKREPVDEINGIKISIPFRSKALRDGMHFVGVEHGDKRYPHAYTRHSTEPGTASCIFPCVDDPKSRHPWSISIKCPLTLADALAANDLPKLTQEDEMREMTILCSGVLSGTQIDPTDERKKMMTFECKFAAAQHIGFAIGPFEHVHLWSEFRTEESDEKLGVNAAKIHGYCLPGRAKQLRHTCAPIVLASDFFALEVAKHPFDSYKICFLDDMIPDTVSVNSLSMCSNRLLYDEDILDMEIDVTRKLVHSLASQYLGVHIIPDERSDAWIVIGLQWFMTDLFMKSLCGLNWYKFHIKTLVDKLIQQDINRPSLKDMGQYLYLGDFELDFMELKAPLVLFIMDQRMMKYPGGSGISRVMSQLVSAANISDTLPDETCINEAKFVDTCEKTSHYRLDKFWQQWVQSAGCPRLNVKQRFNKKNLNVDIQIQQTPAEKKHAISKEVFWREYQEDLHEVFAGEVPALFTGPFTVRIHEADGTPYEHYLDIREDDKDGVNWSIPYNTKYKRLKKSKRRDGAMAAAAANHLASKADLQDDDVVYFNMLGDVLQSDQEKQVWGLNEWEKQVQDAMDQESFEWIRFDCNFEWLAQITADMPGYMYLAQLQQDRDVVAHQDAMLFFKRAKRHSMISTIEVRTLMDKRYFHGIRTMAASDLPKQATADLNYWGLGHLVLAFRHSFCYPTIGRNGNETWTLAPNDFSDKAQYAVQCAIPLAIARTRENNRCSVKARSFLWELVQFNDNVINDYSDRVYIGKLLEALTTSIMSEDSGEKGTVLERLNLDDDDDAEFGQFIGSACETIERFRRMDEWSHTYHNVWTVTAMDCKMRLMKAKVIPLAPIEFLQYCQDENLDTVRIKAYECLMELGLIFKPLILKLFLHTMSTDSSPFVRDQLFRAFCRGIAAIGLGEYKVAELTNAVTGDEMEVDDDDDGGLVVEAGEVEMQQRKLDAKRREDIGQTLAALKEELKGNVDVQIGIWKALQSPFIGLKEMQNMLELCAAMFDKEDSLQVTFPYPKVWGCHRGVAEKGPNGKKRCIVVFSSTYRTTPKTPRPILPPPPPVVSLVSEDRAAERPKIKLSSKGSSGSGPNAPAAPGTTSARTVSISLSGARATPAPAPGPAPTTPASARPVAADSIAVMPAVRVPTTSVASPAVGPKPQKPNGHGPEKKTKAKKRASEVAAKGTEPPAKKAKVNGTGRQNGQNNRRQKIVTVKFTAWDKLPPHVLAASEAHTGTEGPATSMAAAPTSSARVSFVLPTEESPTSTPGSTVGSAKQRKPLPTSAPLVPPVNDSPTATVVNGVPGDAPGTAPQKKSLKIKLKTKSAVK